MLNQWNTFDVILYNFNQNSFGVNVLDTCNC